MRIAQTYKWSLAGCALGLALLIASAPLHAQRDGAPAIGTRVRVVLSDSLRPAPFAARRVALVGTLTRLSSDTLAMLVVGDTLHLARTSIRGLAVSRGASRGRSAAEQALLAGLSFAVVSYASNGTSKTRGRHAANAAAAGVVVGALVGAFRPYEHWARVRP